MAVPVPALRRVGNRRRHAGLAARRAPGGQQLPHKPPCQALAPPVSFSKDWNTQCGSLDAPPSLVRPYALWQEARWAFALGSLVPPAGAPRHPRCCPAPVYVARPGLCPASARLLHAPSPLSGDWHVQAAHQVREPRGQAQPVQGLRPVPGGRQGAAQPAQAHR